MLRPTHRHIQSVLLSLSTLFLLATGCGRAVHSGKTSPTKALEYRQVIAADGAVSSAALSLRSDRTRYVPGQAITLSLVNDSSSTYGSSATCATPTTIWLRAKSGLTYFINSGTYAACVEKAAAIAPGSRAAIATVDSAMVWVDQSTDDKLFRLPSALPTGVYTVHALTSRGELVTRLEIARSQRGKL